MLPGAKSSRAKSGAHTGAWLAVGYAKAAWHAGYGSLRSPPNSRACRTLAVARGPAPVTVVGRKASYTWAAPGRHHSVPPAARRR